MAEPNPGSGNRNHKKGCAENIDERQDPRGNRGHNYHCEAILEAHSYTTHDKGVSARQPSRPTLSSGPAVVRPAGEYERPPRSQSMWQGGPQSG